MPLVSVIIPNYNHAAFLKQRIESVLNQTFQDFELIILDDCSTDNSREIIELYKDNPHISHIVFNESNSGSTFKQWNKGIKLTSGNFVWIAESDDTSDESFLESVIKEFSVSVGLVYTQSNSIDEAGVISYSFINHTSDLDSELWNHDFVMGGCEFVKIYMLLKNPIPNASAVVFKKDLYFEVGGLNTLFTINGDWDFYTRILKKCSISFIHKPLNCFRQHSNNGSLNNIQNGNNIKEYYWLAKRWVRDVNLTKNEKKKLLGHIYKIWLEQVGSNSKELFKHQFMKIFPSAFQVDKKIIFRILSIIK